MVRFSGLRSQSGLHENLSQKGMCVGQGGNEGNGSAVTNACCSPRGPEFRSQHPHGVVPNSFTPAPGDLTTSQLSCTYVACIHEGMPIYT